MTKIDLHIVSFDVPYPADYGGVIDVYYKLKSLKEEGVSVALHCFHYGRGEQSALKELCAEVYYYPRKTGFISQLSATPYIVSSRNHPSLLKNLEKDDSPILFEGLHTTYYLGHPKLKGRKTAVRVHNLEANYYKALAKQSNSIYKKSYYGIESQKLKYFDKRLTKANVLFCLSKQEQTHYQSLHLDARYLPVFHPFKKREVSLIKHMRSQAIYFGNLGVEENIEAVEFLMDLFKELNQALKIVGRGAESNLVKKMDESPHTEYLGELSDSDLKRLIGESKICCLPTPQATGIKLKWVQALFQANEIVLNQNMLVDDQFSDFCRLAENKEQWKSQIQKAFSADLDEETINQRIEQASKSFDNKASAKILKEWCAEVQ
jgi:hypothetical protein